MRVEPFAQLLARVVRNQDSAQRALEKRPPAQSAAAPLRSALAERRADADPEAAPLLRGPSPRRSPFPCPPTAAFATPEWRAARLAGRSVLSACPVDARRYSEARRGGGDSPRQSVFTT